MALLDLPEDILLIILLNLDPKDHLNFCRTSRPVYQAYRQDSLYWRTATSSTFRIPISPLLAADGPRWYSLYKKLKTQTRLYTWGQGRKGSLGHGRAIQLPLRRPRGMVGPVRRPPRVIFERINSTWPTDTHVPDEVGIIADLQCGGWSTTILSSDGKLFTTGSLDSLNGITIGESTDRFKQLEYLTQSTSSVQQFSSGRRHVLALTDDGEILSWDRLNGKGLKPFSRTGRDFGGRPTRVVAGWDTSSAYVPEVGIVYWKPIRNDQSDEMLDGIHVSERVVPGTARAASANGTAEVSRHIVLAEFIVWITPDSKLYACGIGGEPEDLTGPTNAPFEVPGYSSTDRELKDVQGQFQNFGVFTGTGEVLAGNVDYLRRCALALFDNTSLRDSGDWSSHQDIITSRPADVPSLQHAGVIALAYGDHHYLALHVDGRISALGRDSGSCGQMGLGDPGTGGRFRGLHRDQMQASRDAFLLPIAERTGRQIWFEPEKKDWLSWLEETLKQKDFKHDDGQLAYRIWDNLQRSDLFSQWTDQEGRHWKNGPQRASDAAEAGPSTGQGDESTQTDYDDLEPYFAITVAAAGWHSGALVLVDEEKAHLIREKWFVHHDEGDDGPVMPGAFESKNDTEEYIWKQAGFPKVELPDGFMMPGVGEPRVWRDGRPSLAQLGAAEEVQSQ